MYYGFRHLLAVLPNLRALARLERATTDYVIKYDDYPRYGGSIRAHYTVTACRFFDYGRGKGRTIREAANRALNALERAGRATHRDSPL